MFFYIPCLNTRSLCLCSHDFDTPGPMGKTAFDIAALLDVLYDGPFSLVDEMGGGMEKALRIGISDITTFKDIDDEGVNLYYQAAAALGQDVVKQSGVLIDGHREITEEPNLAVELMYRIHQRADWETYLGKCEGNIRTLEQLVAWHDAHPVCEPLRSTCDQKPIKSRSKPSIPIIPVKTACVTALSSTLIEMPTKSSPPWWPQNE